LPANVIPQSQAVINITADSARGASEDFIDTIIDRWRGATMSHKSGLDGGDVDSMARDEFSTLSVTPQAPSVAPQPSIPPQPAAPPRLDPDRFRLLKRPIEGGSTLGSPAPGAPPQWRR